MSEILACFQGLLSPDKDIRTQAENHLKSLENQQGIIIIINH